MISEDLELQVLTERPEDRVQMVGRVRRVSASKESPDLLEISARRERKDRREELEREEKTATARRHNSQLLSKEAKEKKATKVKSDHKDSRVGIYRNENLRTIVTLSFIAKALLVRWVCKVYRV